MTVPLLCPFCGAVPETEPKLPEVEGDGWGWVQCVSPTCVARPRVGDGLRGDFDDQRRLTATDSSRRHAAFAVARWNAALTATHGRILLRAPQAAEAWQRLCVAFACSDALGLGSAADDVMEALQSLLAALGRQDPSVWDRCQRQAVDAFLASWQAAPIPTRADYEKWSDALVDAAVHISPW